VRRRLLDLSLARESGLILTGRVGKHTDAFAQTLIWNTEGKTAATVWFTDGWKAYERQLSDAVELWVGKSGTQRLERTNGMMRQQNARFHRRRNKFSKVWEQTERVVRLAITPWSWWNITTYPTLL
jgi:IS1 family transposase